jgi:hypothetical protein
MATVTITTTAEQDARIASAFRKILELNQNPTGAQIKAWLIDRLREAVLNYEREQQRIAITVEPFEPT